MGSIEVGKKVDITLIETKAVNMQPIYDYYSANAGNVDTVIVNGKGEYLELTQTLEVDAL